MKILLIIIFQTLTIGNYTCKDTNNNETYFVFKKYTGYYSKINTFGEYYYFDWWQEKDIITIAHKNNEIYHGVIKYRLVDNRLIEINNKHTIIMSSN